MSSARENARYLPGARFPDMLSVEADLAASLSSCDDVLVAVPSHTFRAVLETIALRHMRVKVGALSCITNLAAGISETELSHEEVERTASASRDKLVALLRGWIVAAGAL